MPASNNISAKTKWIGILVAFLLIDALLVLWWHQRAENRFDQEILSAALRYGLDPALVKAVVWQESKFDASATGKAGEIGLMQVCEPAAEEWAEAEKLKSFSHREIFDPRKNLRAGSWYLGKLLKRYKRADNPLPYALADYNAGRSHVLRWSKGRAETNSQAFLAAMDFPGTKRYALAIMNRREYYQKQFGKPKSPS